MRPLPLWPPMLLMAGALVWWNQLPLHDRSMHTRTKDLSFVPDPPLSRMLCLGQCGAASKLQWIDSFSYIELQFDRRNDTLMGSHQSGFMRLYDGLIAEDPWYLPFYEYGSFCLGGVLSRHDLALGLQLRGIEMMPGDPWLRQQAAAELYTSFSLEDRRPDLMTDFLNRWADATADLKLKRQVWDWMAAMSRRHQLGTAQMAYWQAQLDLFPPNSTEGRYIIEAMREELAHSCLQELQALCDAHLKRQMSPVLALEDCLDQGLIAERYPHGLPPYCPVQRLAGRLVLRCDPYGYPFHLHGTEVVSPGLDRNRLVQMATSLHLQAAAAAKATPIADLAQLEEHLPLPWLPPEGHWRYQHGDLELVWDEPPSAPWLFHASVVPPGPGPAH